MAIFCLNSLAYGQMASVTFHTSKEVDFKKEVAKLYNLEIANEQSVLSLAMRGYAAKHDAVLEWNFQDVTMSVDLDTTVMAASGKGGLAHYASTHLVPIWLSYPGTGLFTEIVGWLLVSDSVDLEAEVQEIRIDEIKDAQLFAY